MLSPSLILHFFLLISFQAHTASAGLSYIPSPFNSISKTSHLLLLIFTIGTFLYDLGADSLTNAEMAQAWTFGNLSPTDFTRTSVCGPFNLMGGLGILTQSTYLERTYSNLPSHAYVDFLITVFTIDNWQSSDFLTIQIDGATMMTFYPQPYTGVYVGNVCGDSTKPDTYTDFIGRWTHSAASITIRITASLASPSASFGIFQVQLQFLTTSSPSTIAPLKCPGNWCQYSSSNSCFLYKYFPVGGSACASCPAGCYYCWGSAANQCYSCYTGYSFDGTSCIPCPSNCRICTSTTQCDACNSGFVLDTDNTCKLACDNSNAIIKGVGAGQYCVDPCPGGQKLQWDNTCTSTCTSPLIPVSNAQGNFCDFPCDDNEYLYPNGTCGTYCNSPYKIKVDQQGNYLPKSCNYPCATSDYLYEDGSCHSNCPQSMVISTYENQIKLCSMPTLTPEETKEIEKTASTTKASGTVGKAGLAAVNIASPSNPGSLTSGSLQKMLLYVRYLNVSQTLRLEALFKELGSDSTDFIPMPSLPQTFINFFPSYSLPYMFTKYNLSSNFIVNCGDDIISLLIWTAAFLIPFLLDKVNRYLRNLGLYRRVINRSKIILQNYLFGQLYELVGQIIFFTVLDLRVNEFTSEKDSLSLVIIILCLMLCIAFLAFYCWILYRYQKLKKPSKGEEAKNLPFLKFKNKYEGVQLFYQDFVDTSFTYQGFLFFSLMRTIIFYLVIALMTAHPIPQVVLLVLLNLSILIYLVWKRPLKSKIELAQQVSFELVFMTANLSFFVMALTDYSQYNWLAVRRKTSEVVIVCNVIFTFLPIAFMAFKLLITAWELYHWIKDHLSLSDTIKPATKMHIDSSKTIKISQDSSSLQLNARTERNEQRLSFVGISAESFRVVSYKNKRRRIRPGQFFEDESVEKEISMWKNLDRTRYVKKSNLHLNI